MKYFVEIETTAIQELTQVLKDRNIIYSKVGEYCHGDIIRYESNSKEILRNLITEYWQIDTDAYKIFYNPTSEIKDFSLKMQKLRIFLDTL